MPTGRLGAFAIPTAQNTTVYTVQTGLYAVCNVCVVNRNASSTINLRVALSASGTPNPEEWIEYDTIVVPNGVYERTGLVLQAGLNIVVYSSSNNVGCTVYGIETPTT